MSEVKNDLDDAVALLEQQCTTKEAKEKADPDFDEEEEDEELTSAEVMEAASDCLKKTAILLEFLSDAAFCPKMLKRDRELASQQAERVWAAAQALDEAIEEEDEEEDE